VRIERLRTEWDIDIRFVHFPLHPKTPTEGMTLEQLFAGRGIDISAAQVRMKQLMEIEGLPYGDRRMTYNSRLAQEFAAFMVTQPDGEQIHNRLFQAYFADGINIALIENLIEIASGMGVQESVCRDELSTGHYRSAVDQDWERSRKLGVTSVPTFVAGQHAAAGAQPYDVLEQLLEHSGAVRR